MKHYTFGFIHSTKYGKEEFKEYMNEIGGKFEPELQYDDWQDFTAYVDYYAKSDKQAKEIGLKLFEDLNNKFLIDTFTISGETGFYFTEENL